MKFFVALCFVTLVAYSSARPNGSYTDRYDNLDLDEILNNSRLRVPYVKCLLGKGKCSPDGKELKCKWTFLLSRLLLPLIGVGTYVNS